jgi:hypothetical protein
LLILAEKACPINFYESNYFTIQSYLSYVQPMHDIDSALDDISRIRDQLAASTRFEGLAPKVVGLTGVLAFALGAGQSNGGDESLIAWILLAAICAALIGTEAIIRARKHHRAMADRLLNTTLQRFLPTAMAGAVVGLVIIVRLPEHVRLLPGLWQLLMGVGIFAVLGNLPRQMVLAAIFYFTTGTVCLLLSTEGTGVMPWLMGVPFGVGQLLVAGILHIASSGKRHV